MIKFLLSVIILVMQYIYLATLAQLQAAVTMLIEFLEEPFIYSQQQNIVYEKSQALGFQFLMSIVQLTSASISSYLEELERLKLKKRIADERDYIHGQWKEDKELFYIYRKKIYYYNIIIQKIVRNMNLLMQRQRQLQKVGEIVDAILFRLHIWRQILNEIKQVIIIGIGYEILKSTGSNERKILLKFQKANIPEFLKSFYYRRKNIVKILFKQIFPALKIVENMTDEIIKRKEYIGDEYQLLKQYLNFEKNYAYLVKEHEKASSYKFFVY